MIIIDESKKEEKPNYECERDGQTGRQRALDVMLDAIKTLNVCPACAASGALYLAATAWVNSLDRGFDEFMQLAETIFRSTMRQRDQGPGPRN